MLGHGAEALLHLDADALKHRAAASFLAGGSSRCPAQVPGAPWCTLALVFTTTALLTSLATNNVAAVQVFPITLEAAASMGVVVEPFIVLLMVAASASFATPIGYQTNLMVFNAGGYRFSDFLRVGITPDPGDRGRHRGPGATDLAVLTGERPR